MNLDEKVQRALEESVVHRRRKQDLFTFGTTRLPYVFIANSSINTGCTLIRNGEINTDKPNIFIGNPQPSLEGFGEEEGEDQAMALLMARRFRFPPLKVENRGAPIEVRETELERVVDDEMKRLDGNQDSKTAVISGPEDGWQFSLLLYAMQLTQQSAVGNLKDFLDRGHLPEMGWGGLGD